MDAKAVLDKLTNLGIKVSLAGDKVRLEPGSKVPPPLLEEVKARKRDIILHLGGYRLKYPDNQNAEQELKEIAGRVRSVGYVLLWSRVLQDLIAFYRDEEAKAKIPPGFVPYSDCELRELFGEGKPPPSPAGLRLIHAAKKLGSVITPPSG